MMEIPLPKCDEADYIMGKVAYEVTTMSEENEMEFIFTTLTRFVNSDGIKDKLMRPLHETNIVIMYHVANALYMTRSALMVMKFQV